MHQRLVVRYSNTFKRHVISELESGRFGSISEAQEHFGIKGGSTITCWLRKYGRNHLCAKVVRVEKPDEQNQIRELKKQVRQLKEALGQTQAEKIIGDAFLEIACEDMGVEVKAFKKKVDIERSIKESDDQKPA
jgi:transposase-like protein